MSIVSSLKNTLADSYMLYIKTQNYHWNVVGANFSSLHLMFEEQYIDLANAIDLIAERIRTFGNKVPAKISHYSSSAILEGNENFSANEMIQDLALDQKKIIKTLENALSECHNASDEVTAGIVTDRIEIH